MPRFFSAPPKPACSWPLKWFIEMTMSASAMAEPIFGALQYSPSISISRHSVPFRPSAMMTSHLAEMGLKPFSIALRRWSTAFERPPE